jgi:iron uptake system component EfeO
MPRTQPSAALLASILLAGTGLAGCGGDKPASTTAATETTSTTKVRDVELALTDHGCAPAAVSAPAGPLRVVVRNRASARPNEVELSREGGDRVLGESEDVATGGTGELTLVLQPGRYQLDCLVTHAPGGKATLTVTGGAAQNAAAEDDLTAAVGRYRRYVQAESDALVKQTTAFVAALRAGDLERAKALFGPARLHYEAIEPIAESFGDLDPEIDARVNDVEDRAKWTGFHRIEQILWQRDTTNGTAVYASKLLADVRKLDRSIAGLQLQAAQVANGAVELLDEVAKSKITGEEDRYSHTDLSDFQGNLSGAQAAFGALEPVLVARGDGQVVKDVETQLATVQKGLDRYKRDTALGFASYAELSAADRRHFAQQITALTEPLSQVAGKVVGR